ncbi:MAG: hybrid histidine protein kinase/response regulator SinK [Myxococcaceae bacterium]|nr:hybrid histidine protein kinase/response regulator SinK [Myxococcaceae bacterium]
MTERTNPLDALLRAVETGDLKAARAAAETLSQGPGSNPMQLAAEVLHELRQPLLGIKGYLQMLGEDDGPHRPTLPLILAQVERMEQIVADFTRLASNRPAPKERLVLPQHVQEALATFLRNPESAKCSVEVDAPPGVEIHGNARLIEQLVLNLLNNARDAMGGRGRIKVVVGRELGAPVLFVADWGPGIAPELRERLFQPYVTSRQRGSGLGLAVCRRIAEEHGATIELAPPTAIPGENPPPATVFRVRFPPEAAPAVNRRKRLLIVDDESIIRSIFRDLMGKECEVVEAETAEEALAQLRAVGPRFDLIVTDKNLPGLSGLELAQEARRLDPSSRVMIMTGYPSLVTAQQALELGVVDYLLKPFDDIRQVREKIREVLQAPGGGRTVAQNKRVDIYEDNPLTAKAVSDALQQLGMDPQILTEPVPGGTEPPAAVVVSWDFGPARGTAAVELGKAMAKGAPFVVLVEHLSMEITLEALRAGCAACLPKLLSDARALSRELSRALKVSP